MKCKCKRLLPLALVCVFCLGLFLNFVPTLALDEESDPSEEITTGSLSCDFMRGMDLSTFYTNWENGVVYYDENGNEYKKANGNPVQFCEYLYEKCGVDWIRLRVWNDPYDELMSMVILTAAAISTWIRPRLLAGGHPKPA